jgi:hypothetical protein
LRCITKETFWVKNEWIRINFWVMAHEPIWYSAKGERDLDGSNWPKVCNNECALGNEIAIYVTILTGSVGCGWSDHQLQIKIDAGDGPYQGVRRYSIARPR